MEAGSCGGEGGSVGGVGETLTPFELGYLACLIDGEGSISFSRRDRLPRVIVGTTDHVLVPWISGLFPEGSNSVSQQEGFPHWSPKLRWEVSGKKAKRVLEILVKVLKLKRRQARLALMLMDLQPGYNRRKDIPCLRAKADRVMRLLKKLNERGRYATPDAVSSTSVSEIK